MSAEQRVSVRKRTLLRGRIVFNNGASSMDCLVRDLSEDGARLELSETMTLPEVFDLQIAQKSATYRSTLRWRRDEAIGVTFATDTKARSTKAPPETATATPDGSLALLLRRISELEAENAALRSLLAGMGQTSPGQTALTPAASAA